MNKLKSNKGITLIALAITIVVLVVLAGVSIQIATKEDQALIDEAKEAKTLAEESGEKTNDLLNEYRDASKEDVQVEEFEVETFASKINANNYGDYVNYSKDLGLTLNLEGETSVPKTDWRIFYKEGERVYLIAADYVPNTSTLLKVAETGMTTNGDYSLYWSSAPSALALGTRKDSLFGITENSYTLNASNANSKCVSELLDTANWSNFVDTTVADYAIGAPTIEMYTNSWNAKGYTAITITSTDDLTGYKMNGADSVNMSGAIGYSNNLYYPHKTYDGIGTEKCYGYWLASPANGDASYIIRVRWDGFVSRSSYDYNYVGVRPIVSLQSGITAEKDSNGIWQLGI